jgi:hypothetical protein
MVHETIRSEPDRLQIIDNGWKQGSVVEYSNIDVNYHVCSSLKSGVNEKHKAKLILISQDCDIASTGEDKVECLILRRDRKRTPGLENGQNPRKIQFGPINDSYWYIQADDIIFISKEYFKKNKATNDFIVSENDVGVLKQWKANRYTRTGLPENFVSFTKHIFNPLPRDGHDENSGLSKSELFEKFSTYISSIRVHCIESDNGRLQCCFLLLYQHFRCKNDKIDIDEIEELFEKCLLERLRKVEEIELVNDDDSPNSLLNSLKFSDVMSDMYFPLGATKMFPRYYFDPESFADKEDDSNFDEE